MKKLRFTEGLKPITSDMNSIHDLVEEAIADLISAIGGSGTGKVLFDNLPASAAISGNNLTVNVPAQSASISGSIGSVGAQSQVFDVAGADLQVGVYLILSDAALTPETRNFLTVDSGSGTLINQNLSVTMFTDTAARIAYITATDLAETLQDPPLGPSDIGFVLLSTVQFDASASPGNQISVLNNSVDVYSLPSGTQISVGAHAASHLPGGNDPIQLAALSGSAGGGSVSGLMPSGAYTAVLGAVQDIISSDSAPYFVISRAGDNTVSGNEIDNKIITLDLRTDGSLTSRDVSGSEALAVNYLPANSTNGAAQTAARSDHIHLLSQSGFIYTQVSHTLITGDLGTIIPFVVSAVSDQDPTAVLDSIISAKVFWAPANLKSTSQENKLEVGWWREATIGSLGARAHVTGKNTINLEIGEGGVTYLTQSTIDTINDTSTGWVSSDYSGGQFPATGTLIVEIIGLRAGAVG